MAYGHLVHIDERGVATVTLDRPEVHNAFNAELIAALDATFTSLGAGSGVRCLVLRGAGKSFSAGADLGWMKQAATSTRAQNIADGVALGRMLRALHSVPQPTLALVHGNCFAGGTGLAAACDVAIAVKNAVFSLSEVRLGLVPAMISPYLDAAMGARNCRRLFLTAERFDGSQAQAFGLVHETVEDDAALDVARDRFVGAFLAGAPGAQRESKRLVDAVANRRNDDELMSTTATFLAEARASAEGQEGLAAFFAKRKPGWVE